jgi:hypothetical protein
MDRSENSGHAQRGKHPMRNKNPGLLVIFGLAALTLTWVTVPHARAIFIPDPVPTPAPPVVVPPNTPPPCHETPEPATLLSGLVGGGLLSLIAYRKRRKAAHTAGSVVDEMS